MTLVAALDQSDSRLVPYLLAVLNSFAVDYWVRQTVSANLNMFFIKQIPVPRIDEVHQHFTGLVHRAARLICTTPEFDALAREVGLAGHEDGATNEAEFFAVATEAFFEKPEQMKKKAPALYEELAQFFHVRP